MHPSIFVDPLVRRSLRDALHGAGRSAPLLQRVRGWLIAAEPVAREDRRLEDETNITHTQNESPRGSIVVQL